MNNVLEFLDVSDIKNFLDDDGVNVLSYLLRKVLFSQPELLDSEKPTNIQMTKEFLEQWVAQAMDLKTIGAGNYPIDVYDKDNHLGIDIKFISAQIIGKDKFKIGTSNETSLAQNFANEGNSLDQLFAENNYQQILDNWKILLTRKFEKAISELKLEKIYYFIFIRGGNAIYLGVTSVDSKLISNLEVDFGNDKSVYVKNYVNENYGQVKIYKSKKRMELRTYPKNLWENNKLLKFDFDEIYKQKNINLRKLMSNKDDFKKYLKNEFETLFKDYLN